MEATEAPSITKTFNDHDIRIVENDGEPWLVARDVCGALEHSDTSMAVSRLDEDEKGTSSICTPGGDQEMTVISEAGTYRLIFTSRKPEADKDKLQGYSYCEYPLAASKK